ncbi:MAG: leucyl/phenylalanyl-tRNA--protein transferase [Gammaproteobacteria bacterium]|nr:MAG: leucyl/phenylalanyl-tRNA--protein transferase [Gammaproteobacteria bacterium]
MTDKFDIFDGPLWLREDDNSTPFPPAGSALSDPNGLLAIGGSLTVERLLMAYKNGIFPWYNHDQPIMWWAPDPRTVLYTDELKIARSLRKTIRKNIFSVSFDRCFRDVMQACAAPRKDDNSTWIHHAMLDAYCRLHDLGYAHSVEVWHENKLVGGLYGVAIGRMYYGESMFSLVSDASKVGFAFLIRQLQSWGFTLVDCQIHTAHLQSLGARIIPRERFLSDIREYQQQQPVDSPWQLQLTRDDIL